MSDTVIEALFIILWSACSISIIYNLVECWKLLKAQRKLEKHIYEIKLKPGEDD